MGCSCVPGSMNCICWANMAAAAFCWIRLFLPLISSWVFRWGGGCRYLQFSRVQRPWRVERRDDRWVWERTHRVTLNSEYKGAQNNATDNLNQFTQMTITTQYQTLPKSPFGPKHLSSVEELSSQPSTICKVKHQKRVKSKTLMKSHKILCCIIIASLSERVHHINSMLKSTTHVTSTHLTWFLISMDKQTQWLTLN